MVEAATKFMKKMAPNNPEGYRLGFHRPPKNSKYHLHLHCIVLPLKQEKHEKTYGTNLTKPEEVIKYLEWLNDVHFKSIDKVGDMKRRSSDGPQPGE